MPRQLTFICRLIRLVYSGRTQLHSIRLKSSGDAATEVTIHSNIKIGLSVVESLVDVGLNFDDTLYVGTDGAELSKDELNAAAHTPALRVVLRHERCVDQSRLISEIKESTPFWMPPALRKSQGLSDLSIFYGASSIPIDLKASQHGSSSVYSNEGIPYVVQDQAAQPGLTIRYLDADSYPTHRQLEIDEFLPIELRLSAKRRQFKSKTAVTVWCSDCVQALETTGVRALFPQAITRIISLFEKELTSHYQKEVKKLTDRMRAVKSRTKVFYQNEFIGYRPANELETVILLERYLHRTDYALLPGAAFELLEYSAGGIDGICEFSPSTKSPKSIRTVEFEYHLKNFFQHGHDLHQVDLIICYTDNGIDWPFEHYGLTYTIENSNGFPRLRTSSGDASAYLFILSNMLTES